MVTGQTPLASEQALERSDHADRGVRGPVVPRPVMSLDRRAPASRLLSRRRPIQDRPGYSSLARVRQRTRWPKVHSGERPTTGSALTPSEIGQPRRRHRSPAAGRGFQGSGPTVLTVRQ